MTLWITALLTVLIIAASAFFVIIEFSLLAARRHRLEDSAVTSRPSRAALRNLDELTMMLAGAQLGITVCTFALGATAKPAVHYALIPVLSDAGLPLWTADAVAFAVALFAMTFLHLVVGEMAPKSWAISHPELSARAVAVPSRIFMWVFRPLLQGINTLANRLVAATGVEPVNQAADASYDPQTLRHLVRHSTQVGVLDEEAAQQIDGMMQLEDLTVEELMTRRERPAPIAPQHATVRAVQDLSQHSGQRRVLLQSEDGEPIQVVHVRDTLELDDSAEVLSAARPALTIDHDCSVLEALRRMRDYGEQLVAVMDGYKLLGIVTWDDMLQHLWPELKSAAQGVR